VKKKARKDETGDQLKEVKEQTEQALAAMKSEFQMQLNQMKDLLVSSKADEEETRRKQAEDEELRKKEREELEKASKNGAEVPTDSETPSTSKETQETEEDHVGKLLTAVLGVRQGKQKNSSTDSAIYQPYLIRGATLDKKLKTKIWAGEFIDLSQLVTKVDHSSTVNMSYTESLGTQINLAPVKSRPPNTFGEWFRQFNIYVCIYIQKFPEEGPSLITYMDKIYTLSQEKPLSYTWRAYDESFRRIRAVVPDESRFDDMPWHITVEALLREARDASFSSKTTQNQSFRGQNGQKDTLPTTFQTQNQGQQQQKLCFDYNNRTKGCSRAQCRFAHRCRKCNRPNHPVYLCRANQNAPPAAGSSSSSANTSA
ncbi:MAG: hypothetical protein GY702_26185, partial [Desulfobulbaceae bacterium]|nr:hypothetical protein [Desulfobulbaceae bacterium]